jgi:hypothetical protein
MADMSKIDPDDGLIWYRSAGVSTVHYVPRGTLGPHKYKTIVDNFTGVEYQVRVTIRNLVTTRAALSNLGGIRRKELMYTEDQFDMIRSAMWNVYNGRINFTIGAQILKELGWAHLPGQTPLSMGKMAQWYEVHVKYRKRGILWP